MKKSSYFFLLFFLIVFLPIAKTQSQSSIESEAAIKQAETKLKETIHLLEIASKKRIDIVFYAVQVDIIRVNISTAKLYHGNGTFSLSFTLALDAINTLNQINTELGNKITTKNTSSIALYVIFGLLSIFGYISFSWLFIRKIYPWYKMIQQESYGELEIKYNGKNESKRRGE